MCFPVWKAVLPGSLYKEARDHEIKRQETTGEGPVGPAENSRDFSCIQLTQNTLQLP